MAAPEIPHHTEPGKSHQRKCVLRALQSGVQRAEKLASFLGPKLNEKTSNTVGLSSWKAGPVSQQSANSN
jgi:hypothetical protein